MAFDVAIKFSVAGADQAEKAIAGIGNAATASADKVQPAHKRIRDGVESISTQLSRLQGLFATLAGISVLGIGVREIADLADAYAMLHARLALATGSSTAAAARFQDLLGIANAMQQPMADVSQVYLGIARSSKELGASQQQLTKFTEGVAASIRLSGTSGQAASGALTQLAQAMGGANIQAQEFNSLVDGAPELLRAVAANIGKTGISMAELRERVIKGNLSSKEFFEAFLRGADDMTRKAQQLPPTIGGSITQIKNNLLNLVGGLDKALGGVSEGFAKALQNVANVLPKLIDPLRIAINLFAPAAKIAAAYFAIFVAAPAVISAVGTAMLALRTAVLTYYAAAAIAGSSTSLLAGGFSALKTALLGAATGVNGLKLALGSVLLIFAAFELGKWAYDNFEPARRIMDGFYVAALKGIEYLKYGFQVLWLGAKTVFFSVFEQIGGFFASTMDMVAKGLSLIGQSEMAARVRAMSDSLRGATQSGVDFSGELANLKAKLDTGLSAADAMAAGLAKERDMHFKTAGAVSDHAEKVEVLDTKKSSLSKTQEGMLGNLQKELDKLREQNETYGLGEDAVLAYNAAKAGVSKQSQGMLDQIAKEREQLALKKAATDAEREATDALYKAREQEMQQAIKRAEDLTEQVKKQEEENLKLSMTTAEYGNLELARLREQLRLAELAVQQDEYLLLCNAETQAHKDTVDALKRLIDAKEQGVHLQAAKEANDAWQKTIESIGQGLTDSLYRAFEAGKGFFSTLWDGIKNTFKTTVLKMVVQSVMSPVNAVLGSVMGAAPGAAMAGTGGAAGGLGNLISAGQSLLTNGAAFLNGSMMTNGATFGVEAAGNWLVNNTSGSLNQLGGSLMQNSGMLGTGLGMLGNAFAGYGISKALSGGYSAGSWVNTVAGIASAIPGIGPIAGVVGGLVNRAFGRKPKEVLESGVEGSLSGGNVTGQAYQSWIKKGGWFRSSKRGTDYSDMNSEMEAALDMGALGVLEQTKAYAAVLQLPAQALANVSTTFKFKLSEDQEETQQAITELLEQYQRDLSFTFAATLAPFRKAGESFAETLSRLAALQSFSDALNQFGGVFSTVAAASIGARENLIELAGGIENLVAASQQFVADYYSQEEQAGLQARGITEALKALGLDGAQLGSREDFRALVESLGEKIEDATAQEQLVGLLALGPQFAQLADYLKENNKTLADATAAAPQIAALTLLTEQQQAGQDAQIVATETLNNSVIGIGDQISAVIERLGWVLTHRLEAVEDAVKNNARYIGDAVMEGA